MIKQSVLNTFGRVGIDPTIANDDKNVEVTNRFSGEVVKTTSLVKRCINWVYATNDAYEMGKQDVNLSDFDRIRYWILEVDHEAYSACID